LKIRLFELKYEPWWSKGLIFSCFECGKCCRGDPGAVWVSDQNIADAADVIGLDMDEFRRIFCHHTLEKTKSA